MHRCPCIILRLRLLIPMGRRSVTLLSAITMRQRREQQATLLNQEKSELNTDGITVAINLLGCRHHSNQSTPAPDCLQEWPNRALMRVLEDLCLVKTSYRWLKSNSQNNISNNSIHTREMNLYIIIYHLSNNNLNNSPTTDILTTTHHNNTEEEEVVRHQ